MPLPFSEPLFQLLGHRWTPVQYDIFAGRHNYSFILPLLIMGSQNWYDFRAMSIEEFEDLVGKTLEDLPKFFKEKLENVELTIENWPHHSLSQGRLLLGLYHGIPKTRRGAGYNMVLPDKITIYMGPITMVSRGNPDIIKKVVIDTVQHEIAHHFGISDSRLHELKQH